MNTDEKLDYLIKEMDNIKQNITDIRGEIDTIKKGGERLDSHINFVERTYETLKYPIDFVKEKIENFTSNDVRRHYILPVLREDTKMDDDYEVTSNINLQGDIESNP